MNPKLVHAIFLLILATSVILKLGGSDGLNIINDIEPAVIRAASAGGLTMSAQSDPRDPVQTLIFYARDCPNTTRVTLLQVSLVELSLITAVPPYYRTRYFYLSRVWVLPDRLAIFLEAKKNKARALLGLTEYAVSDRLLRVDSPADCEAASAVDWRAVWQNPFEPSLTRTLWNGA
jgi:hypothetical protein